MVRQSFLKSLPCVETLNRWDCSTNYKPGISKDIINHVSNLVQSSLQKGQRLVFNLTFDEMNIKKWTFYCKTSQEWKGLVDLGGQLQDEKGERQQASKAIVFMLLNINGAFKAPVAYYLTNSLSGEEKCILLKDLLIELHNNSINIVSITFDGDESNQKSCKILGANFDYTDKANFRSYFLHPCTSENVYIFFDPCHMLKLVRNYFALKGPILNKESQKISWDFIKKLNDLQYEEGLHCTCKIRNRHVYFSNEKMKVFLAVQVLSSSTSLALTYVEKELNHPHFKGTAATAEFCKNFNDIFDLLNTKNIFCKTPGTAVTVNSLPALIIQINKFVEYISSLQIYVPIKRKTKDNDISATKSVLKCVLQTTTVRTGFAGLIICLKNLYALCYDLLTKKICNYFLSYKISQDHVEMFFALIRRMNGFTNNPTSIQFRLAYKKLLLNNMNVLVPAIANCTPQDLTLMISDASNANEKSQENENTKQERVKSIF